MVCRSVTEAPIFMHLSFFLSLIWNACPCYVTKIFCLCFCFMQRFFVLDNGILKYSKSPIDVSGPDGNSGAVWPKLCSAVSQQKHLQRGCHDVQHTSVGQDALNRSFYKVLQTRKWNLRPQSSDLPWKLWMIHKNKNSDKSWCWDSLSSPKRFQFELYNV